MAENEDTSAVSIEVFDIGSNLNYTTPSSYGQGSNISYLAIW